MVGILAVRTGFEPVISCVTGKHIRPTILTNHYLYSNIDTTSLTIIDSDRIKIARTFNPTNSILCPPCVFKRMYLYLMVGADGNAPRTRLPTSQSNGFTVRRQGQHPLCFFIKIYTLAIFNCLFSKSIIRCKIMFYYL